MSKMIIPFPNKKYDLIVIDPPWPLKKLTRKARPRQINMDYSTMTIEQIAKLPVGDLARKHCWVFLWTTQKFLFESKPILEGWGFNYLVMSVWEKTYGRSAGMPLFGFQWNAEFILIGYKEKPDVWPKRSLIPLVFQAENVKHSQKPDKFYKQVESLGKNRIDLFARKNKEGWDVWGDEVS